MDYSNRTALALTDDQRAKYREALTRAGAWRACSRCGQPPTTLGIAPALHPVALSDLHEAISGTAELKIDTVVVICVNCGAMYFHAMQALSGHMSDEAAGDG